MTELLVKALAPYGFKVIEVGGGYQITAPQGGALVFTALEAYYLLAALSTDYRQASDQESLELSALKARFGMGA